MSIYIYMWVGGGSGNIFPYMIVIVVLIPSLPRKCQIIYTPSSTFSSTLHDDKKQQGGASSSHRWFELIVTGAGTGASLWTSHVMVHIVDFANYQRPPSCQLTHRYCMSSSSGTVRSEHRWQQRYLLDISQRSRHCTNARSNAYRCSIINTLSSETILSESRYFALTQKSQELGAQVRRLRTIL